MESTTSEAGFTPGPWIYHQPDEQAGIGYEITKYPYTNHRVGEADDEANARLIAAAPAMYEALQRTLTELVGIRDSHPMMAGSAVWRAILQHRIEDIEAALSAATGEGGEA